MQFWLRSSGASLLAELSEMRRRREPGFDLFAWRYANDLEARRREIAAQIQRVRPKSHRRVVLEDRLKQMTLEALKRDVRHQD